MLAARPFASDAALFDAATRFWRALGRADRLEAFSQHPRIGDRAGSQWSMQEQAGAAGASPATRVALVDGNRAYEKRFGHVFLICATGLPADTMLAELRRRMQNDPAKELEIAAGEQEKITRLRLEKLVSP
jgi:2-oxo-4-hydroxy-4-carboxy-5-ureidoimidazoline decarboxylase